MRRVNRNASSGLTDAELILSIRRRDESALDILMHRYYPRVYSTALKVLRCSSDAQEVTQDVFWALWRAPDKFQMARGELVTWLVILSRSRALDLLRRIQAKAARDTEFGSSTLQHSAQAIPLLPLERTVLFDELLNRLPVKQQSVLKKIFLEGYAFSEVAAIEQQPLGTIKGRARFGLKRLRSECERSFPS